MWLRDGTWEIHIQPVFSRDAGSAAWVVPFPVRPTIHAGNADFFDHLELATSPVFVEYCYEPCCSDCYDGGMGAGHQDATDIFVPIWERGTVGELDYVILSSTDGNNLLDWLENEGFEVPTNTGPLVDQLASEGTYFFVARLSPEADPHEALTPIRFVLPDAGPPTYPLRLTSLGVPEGEALDLTLWVIFPDGQPFVPASHPYDIAFSGYMRRDNYQYWLNDFFSRNDPGTLALLYAKSLSSSGFMDDRRCFSNSYWDECVSFQTLGITPPYPPSVEMMEIDDNHSWVTRYQARMTAGAMSKDLVLTGIDKLWELDHMFEYETGACWECPGGHNSDGGIEATGGGGCGCGSVAGGWLAGSILVLLILRRRV